MKGVLDIEGKKIEVDFSNGIDISIPLHFNGEQPNTYNVNKAISKAYEDENFIGDTRRGGPCNFETYNFTPHCNGTHTECIGHITKKRVSILTSLNQEMIASTVVSVVPKNTSENYIPKLSKDDLVITKKSLELQLKHVDPCFLSGLIIRTLPNTQCKKSRDYMNNAPPFLSIDAMDYIVSLGVQHLLIDTPSVDRLFDDGHLTSHNIFWGTHSNKFNLNTQYKTISEMIFVPKAVKDGHYLLNLQVPAFMSDAAPSRPILYKIHEL